MANSVEQVVEDVQSRAAALWAKAEPAGSPPEAIETLKSPRGRSAVLRLHGAGPGGEPVVAKRAARGSIEIEARVYGEVLPRVSVSATRLLAMAPDGDRSWLFLEDAGDEPFQSGRPDHRRLAAGWMAVVHGGARALPSAGALPAREPDHYLDLCRSVEALLSETLANPALSAEELAVVVSLADACEALDSSWAGVDTAFAASPSTIAFGGFSGKNARARPNGDGPELMPFDFKNAGFGFPAIDLANLDGEAYVREARHWWNGLDSAEFNRLRGIGRVLRRLIAIPGERRVLLGRAPSEAVVKLESHSREVVGGMREAGLTGA